MRRGLRVGTRGGMEGNGGAAPRSGAGSLLIRALLAGARSTMDVESGRWRSREDHRTECPIPVPVLIVLMTSALVVAIWGVARDRLVSIVSSALDTVCSGLGC